MEDVECGERPRRQERKVLQGEPTVWGVKCLLGIDTCERKGEEADLGGVRSLSAT